MTRVAATAACAVLLTAGCARTPEVAVPDDCASRRTGDPLTAGFLSGTWHLEWRVTSRDLRYQPPSAPYPPATAVRGTITFDLQALAATRDSVLAPTAPLRGVIHAPLDSVLARTPPGWAAGAVPFAHHALGAPAGAFAVRVGTDSCSACGHLIVRGTRQADLVCGIWRQTFRGTGDRGTFILRRAAQAAS